MKQTSTEFKVLAENPYGARYHIRINDNGTDITQDIDNYKYEHMVNDDDVFLFGNTASALVSFSITEPTVNLHGKEITIYQGINVNGTIQEIKQGTFKVLKPTITRDKTEYQAVDRMTYLLNAPYFSELSYPTTDIAILNEICTQCGIVLVNSNLVSHSISKILNGYTKREIVAYLSQLQGKNAIINSDGNLELIWYNEVDYTIDDNKIYYDGVSDVNSETNYTLGYIECTVRSEDGSSETILRAGDGITGVRILNPLMTQEILEEVFSAIGGFSFMPAEFEFLGDFRLEVGDIVTVETNNTTYRVPIMQLTHKSDGGVITTVASIAETDSENEIDMSSPSIKAMDRYYANLVLINKALVNKLSADEADIRYVQTDQLDAVEANITNAVINNLQGQFADIHLANIDIADIGKLFADVGLITSANIVNGHITGYLDAVEINANKITAGTLSVDRLIFRGGENSIIYELNNITGALQAVQGDTLNGEIITDRSITVDKIVAKSITANEIASATITGNEIVAKSLTSIQIDVEDLFAQNIVANGTITGAKLYGTYAEVTSGKIGGFDISNGKITITNQVYINPTYKECELVRAYNLGTGTLTPQQLSASDINKDGVVNLQDALMMRNLLLNKATIYSYQSNPTLSDVTFTINPADANKTIEFKGVNSWGEAIDNYIGINAIKTSSLTTDGLVFKDCDGEKLEVTSVLKAPRIEFGTNYAYALMSDGGIYASYVVIPNAHAYYVRNKSGTNVTGISMNSNNELCIGEAGYATYIRGSSVTSSAIKTPSVSFGSTYAYYLNTNGDVYARTVTLPNNVSYNCKDSAGTAITCMFMSANNALYVGYNANYHTIIGGKTINLSKYSLATGGMVVPNNIAYYCRNSAGTDINAMFMTANNVLRFGYGASDVWIGNHGTTGRTMIYGTRIDFCCNTAGTSETNPALSLVSSAGGANLTLRPTTVNAVATYLGDSTYYFNTVYYATLSQISDRTTKKDIYDISEKYLELWDKLSVKTFRYIDDDKTIKVGLIAQEVEECAYKVGLTNEECGFILKEYVDNEIHKGYRYSLDYTGLATITMARLKKTIEIVAKHDKRIQDLEDEIAILKATINHLQAQYA